MDVCRGAPPDPNQGFSRTCPLRYKCWRYRHNAESKRPAGAGVMQGPYDFEDEECGQYVEEQ